MSDTSAVNIARLPAVLFAHRTKSARNRYSATQRTSRVRWERNLRPVPVCTSELPTAAALRAPGCVTNGCDQSALQGLAETRLETRTQDGGYSGIRPCIPRLGIAAHDTSQSPFFNMRLLRENATSGLSRLTASTPLELHSTREPASRVRLTRV